MRARTSGNRAAVLPREIRSCRWVGADFRLGDLILFPALTVHEAMENFNTARMRLSVDFRYQLEPYLKPSEIYWCPFAEQDLWKVSWPSHRYGTVFYETNLYGLYAGFSNDHQAFEPGGTPAESIDASQELPGPERLRHVVVGAGFQATHLVVLRSPRCQQDDR